MAGRTTRAAALLLVLSAGLAASSAAAAPMVSEYALPTQGLGPAGMALGAEGDVWFAAAAGPGAVGKITPKGEITEYTTGLTAKSQPTGIAAGPEGNLWFTELADPGRVGVITPSGTITEYPTTSPNSQPTGIALGAEGDLWFTEAANPGRVGRITPSGSITEYPTPTPNSQPNGITQGPDGNMWFTESGGNGAIAKVTPAGAITEYAKGLTTKSRPSGIAAGPDGALWFTESAGAGRIGRITLSGNISEFSYGLTASAEPTAIAAGGDGALYFTELKGAGRIGRITTAGAITETVTPTTNSQPQGIVSGGDGNIWFSELGAHGQIGVLTVAPGVGPASSSATERTAVLKALVAANSQPTSYHFEYGPTAEYGTATGTTSAGSGTGLAPVSAPVSGLQEGTAYHYRVVATNVSGTTYGPDELLTTTYAPAVQSLPASAVTLSGAELQGSVRPREQATRYFFEWGPTAAYGHEAPGGGGEAGADDAAHSVSAALEELTPDQRYHYRVVATNCGGCAEGTSYGADQTFTTAAPPATTTEPASAIATDAATLHGILDPRGAASTYWFEYGQTPAYGSRSGELAGAGGEQAVAAALSSLLPGTVYHYRLVASNCEGCVAGTTFGGDMTFVTEALPLVSPVVAPPPTVGGEAVKPPSLGRSALVKVLAGTVTVRTGAGAAVALQGAADIPMGATVDTRHGALELSTAVDARGDTQTASVWGGVFTVGQSRTGSGMTTLATVRRPVCHSPLARTAASIARSRTSTETLWAHDNHGRFSTRGHDSVATVRGTWWGTTETCAGTLTTVRQGAVSVRPRHGRPVLVRAGHHYLARP